MLGFEFVFLRQWTSPYEPAFPPAAMPRAGAPNDALAADLVNAALELNENELKAKTTCATRSNISSVPARNWSVAIGVGITANSPLKFSPKLGASLAPDLDHAACARKRAGASNAKGHEICKSTQRLKSRHW